VHGGRQHHLRAQHGRQPQRGDMRVVLVYEPRARDVPQQQPQPPRHAPLQQHADQALNLGDLGLQSPLGGCPEASCTHQEVSSSQVVGLSPNHC
jgi:hypothetical protein